MPENINTIYRGLFELNKRVNPKHIKQNAVLNCITAAP